MSPPHRHSNFRVCAIRRQTNISTYTHYIPILYAIKYIMFNADKRKSNTLAQHQYVYRTNNRSANPMSPSVFFGVGYSATTRTSRSVNKISTGAFRSILGQYTIYIYVIIEIYKHMEFNICFVYWVP